jgi:hypothetical protein
MPDKMTRSPPSSVSVCSGMNLYIDSASSFVNNEALPGCLKSVAYISLVYSILMYRQFSFPEDSRYVRRVSPLFLPIRES